MSDKTVKFNQTADHRPAPETSSGGENSAVRQLKSQLASQQKRFANLIEANLKLKEVNSKLKRVNSKRSEVSANMRDRLETANRENRHYKQQLDRQLTAIQRWESDLEKEACRLQGHVPGAARVLTAPTSSSSETPPIVLIASGGSSGSHLLARLLAEYVPFFTGQEPNLAARPDLFDPISFRTALLKGLKRCDPILEPLPLSTGNRFYFVPLGVLTNPAEYRCDSVEGQVHLLESRDWGEMISRLVARLGGFQAGPERGILIEHSPSCAISLPTALQAYPNLKAVHLVRDPRDAISSMAERRAKLPIYASLPELENLSITATQWCALNAVAMRAEGCSGYMQVKYEDLVRDPDKVVGRILAHLGYPNAEQWEGGAYTLSPLAWNTGWRLSPMGKVSTGSIGRYRESLTAEQERFLEDLVVRVPELELEVSLSDYIELFGSADPVL